MSEEEDGGGLADPAGILSGAPEEGRYFPVEQPVCQCPRPQYGHRRWSLMTLYTDSDRCLQCGRDTTGTGQEAEPGRVGGTVQDGLTNAWEVAWPSLKTLIRWAALAIAWMARTARKTLTARRKNDDVERRPEENPPRRESQAPEADESSREEPDKPPPTPESAWEIACTTSDGIHVMTIKNGRDECHVCGIIPAGKAE